MNVQFSGAPCRIEQNAAGNGRLRPGAATG